MARLEEAEHRPLEPRSVLLLRPVVPICLIPVPANLHSLLVVRGLLTELLDLLRVRGLRHSLAADLDEAAIRAGVAPCQLVLLLYGKFEELRALRSSRHEQGLRDTVAGGKYAPSGMLLGPPLGVCHGC